ncbi:MAG: type II toxin-antitoxin system VapC family toxin [Dehalococcoidia bacterium]|nr:type II toxin-antitoxin system VapC family toxin [Dehalococcoidia bacterium]
MAVYYIDSSALVKRYRTEPGTEVLNSLFSGKTEEEVFVTSQFATIEVESVAARGLRGKALTRNAYGVMLTAFVEDLEKVLV